MNHQAAVGAGHAVHLADRRRDWSGMIDPERPVR